MIGEVVAVAPDGVRRPLARGASINAGDAIHTGGRARAQIRFVDGGYVSLQPGTQFRVDEYHYENKSDGKEKGFFSLLKGAMRAITGAIGRTNRNAYRVSTKVATIGIRGTGYNAALEGDGLLVNVGEGAISLTNNAGVLVVSAGEAAFVADFNTAPEFTFRHPSTPAAGLQSPPPDTTFIAGDAPTLYSGPGYALLMASSDVFPRQYQFNGRTYPTAATFSGGTLAAFTEGAAGEVTLTPGAPGDMQTDGILV